jgi:hypothetical protein
MRRPAPPPNSPACSGPWCGRTGPCHGQHDQFQAHRTPEFDRLINAWYRLFLEPLSRMRASKCTSPRTARDIPLWTGSDQQLSVLRSTRMGPTRTWCYAPATRRSSLLPNARSNTCWSECGEHNQVAEACPLTAKTGVRVRTKGARA